MAIAIVLRAEVQSRPGSEVLFIERSSDVGWSESHHEALRQEYGSLLLTAFICSQLPLLPHAGPLQSRITA